MEGKALRKQITAILMAFAMSLGLCVSAEAQVFKKLKKATIEVGDKLEDAKDQTVKGAKEVGDKAEDAKDLTVKGVKKARRPVKKAVVEVGDKAEDAKDQTVKGVKKVKRKVD